MIDRWAIDRKFIKCPHLHEMLREYANLRGFNTVMARMELWMRIEAHMSRECEACIVENVFRRMST
jgi:hypothetical protein